MALTTEARKLLAAEDHYRHCKGALEQAERDRAKARERCRRLLTPGKTTVAGDIELTVTPCVSSPTFRLAQYLRKHKVTKAMEPFVGAGSLYERWVVRQIAA